VTNKGRKDSFSDHESDPDKQPNDSDACELDFDEKRTRVLTMESKKKRPEQFERPSGDLSAGKQTSSNKKQRAKEDKEVHVLTFVDMSRLKYLSRSMSNTHKLKP